MESKRSRLELSLAEHEAKVTELKKQILELDNLSRDEPYWKMTFEDASRYLEVKIDVGKIMKAFTKLPVYGEDDGCYTSSGHCCKKTFDFEIDWKKVHMEQRKYFDHCDTCIREVEIDGKEAEWPSRSSKVHELWEQVVLVLGDDELFE